MDLSTLNEQQRLAVTAPPGPVLVLAGAGSGKTRVLAYRIAYLTEQKIVRPEHILALTFTNKAAGEMRSRVDTLLHKQSPFLAGPKPFLGTFHSFGLRLLREDGQLLGYGKNFTVYDADDSLKVIKRICRDLEVPENLSPQLFRAFISNAKNLNQTPAEFALDLEAYLFNLTRQIYTVYQDWLIRSNAVDFDDLLLLPNKLLENFPEIKQKWLRRIKYILVDEYQDTNASQYSLLKHLAPNGQLFVVGDDAQSIYGFRGSDIGNILNFERDFPNCLVVPLEQNYRSTQYILKIASSIIAINPEQKPKTLWTENPPGEKVWLYCQEDELAEASFVAKKIIELSSGLTSNEPALTPTGSILDHFLKKQKTQVFVKLPLIHESLSEYAVLYRTHAQSRAIEEVFLSAGIPYRIVGGTKFYERKEIKDLLAYLRLLQNATDLISLERVLNVPTRGLGNKSVELILSAVGQTIPEGEIPVFPPGVNLPTKALASAQSFFRIFETLNHLTLTANLVDLMRLLLAETKFLEFLRDGTEQGNTRAENAEELVNTASSFANLPWREGLTAFLEEVSLFTDADAKEDEDSVTLMTLHAAKGLEFDNVFFVGLEEGILPHSRSLLDPTQLAEEIRLAYVGMTRARKRLFLLYAQTRSLFGGRKESFPSRILSALPQDSINASGVNELGRLSGDGIVYEKFEE